MLSLLFIIFFTFIMLGLPNSALGSAWPSMYPAFNVSSASAGAVSLLMSGSTVLASLWCDKAVAKLGFGKLTFLGLLAMALSGLGFSVSTHFLHLCLLAIPMGFGMGFIDAALNNAVALHYQARHMNWLHGFWGVGAFISPVVMSFFLATSHSWQGAYRFIGFVTLGFALIFLLGLKLWNKAPHQVPGTNQTGASALSKAQLLKLPGVKQSLLVFFCYCAIEATVGLWAASFLVGTRNLLEETAALWLSLYFLGITAGRFLAGFITVKLGHRQIIKLGISLIAIGILFFFLPLPQDALMPALFLIGLGCAPIFPSLIHETPANFGAAHSQSIIGLQMAFAYLGSMLMPPLFGLLTLATGYAAFPFYLAFFLILMTFMTQQLHQKTKNN